MSARVVTSSLIVKQRMAKARKLHTQKRKLTLQLLKKKADSEEVTKYTFTMSGRNKQKIIDQEKKESFS